MNDQPAQRASQPPEPPNLPRRLNIPASQLIGAALMLVLPVLALAGVFGESFGSANTSGTDLRLSARYPARLRFQLDSAMQVMVENTGQQSLDAVEIRFDRDYLDQFSNLSFIPSVTQVTSDAYIIELRDLAPGASQAITIELRGERYGRHRGRVVASAGGRTAAELAWSSVVFP